MAKYCALYSNYEMFIIVIYNVVLSSLNQNIYMDENSTVEQAVGFCLLPETHLALKLAIMDDLAFLTSINQPEYLITIGIHEVDEHEEFDESVQKNGNIAIL